MLKKIVNNITPSALLLLYHRHLQQKRSQLLKKHLAPEALKYKVKRYGNEYGGFLVYDNAIKNISNAVVYSFGIGEDLSFNESLMQSFSPHIYAFDPTPRAIIYVKNHPLYANSHFSFTPVGLSDEDGHETFYLPLNDEYVSGSTESNNHLKQQGIEVEMRCLNTLFRDNNHSHVDLLKMDIEGSEFKVIESLKHYNVEISQICVEVHDRFYKNGLKRLRKLITTLEKTGFLLIAISKSSEELTFVKKD